MYNCVVCSNSPSKTRSTRPDVIYHTFPKNEYRRRKWLKMYGIGRCYDWHRVCSDHFLEENYRPGAKRFLKKNTIPQPYDRNCDENGFLSNCTDITQSNDVEMGNNEFLPTVQNHVNYTNQSNDVETSTNELLPREQNHLSYTTQSNAVETSTNEFLPREQNHLRKLTYYGESDNIESKFYREVQNAVINNFVSPRRSCRKIKLTTTNEDMSYENMPRLQTERVERQVPTFIANGNIQTDNDTVVVPVLTTTKDHTLGNGPRCSVKNCFNRYSKDLSFFGYPSDFTLRKKWIEKCGLQVDPTQKVKNGVRVCRAHFEDDCFVNIERKNRLRPDAIPTLFLDDDKIDAQNIPSTISPVNSRFIHVNKPSPINSGQRTRVNKPSPVNNEFIRLNKPSCSSSNYVANMESNQTPLLVYIDSSTRSTKNLEFCCSIPGCLTNTVNEIEEISLFAPTTENVDEWSSILGVDLTTDSIVCERHFKPQDILQPNLLVSGLKKKIKTISPVALPLPMNAVPESRKYCSVPGCITNTVEDNENISFFAPTLENVNQWSSILGLNLTRNSIVCEKHFKSQDVLHPNLSGNDLNSKAKSLTTFALPVSLNSMPEKKLFCCISGCITNTIDEIEDISLFSPRFESVRDWSSILGLQLTEYSIVCERHFRPEDILCPRVFMDGIYQNIKSLVPFALPMPINAGLLTSNATPFTQQLETNDVPVLRTYDGGKFKRHKPDELLCSKTSKNNVLDKSVASTDKMFSAQNKYIAVTNGSHEYNSTFDLDPTLKSNAVQSIDLSIVKIEPLDDDDDLQTNLETETETEAEQTLPTLKTKLVENDDSLPLSSIDDSLSISLKKLKNISANSSLSVTLEPMNAEIFKVTEPSVDLPSKVTAKSSMSITLRPKHNLSSTTNNTTPSVSLPHCLPSVSSSSVYNLSQPSSLQYEQGAASTSKMSDVLSSNTVVRPEYINNQFIFFQPIPPRNKTISSELPEIKTPIISKCISLAVQSNTHDSNPNYSTNTSECIIIDDDTEDFIEKDNGFIYEISKSVVLPNVFWKSVYDNTRNATTFYQQDNNYYETIKNIHFDNSLMPKIQVYGRKYKYNKPITTKNELQNLLDKIDYIEKCSGIDGHPHENCIGYYENSTINNNLCSVCQENYEEFHKMAESQTKTIESFEQKISERTAKVLELRELMENNKINPTPTELVTLRPTSLINSMRVYRR